MPKSQLSSASASPASSRNAGILGALAGLAALAVAMGIGRFAFTPVLPMMLEEGALSIKHGALLASGNYLGYLLGALSAMMLRVEPERAIRSGLIVIALTTIAMGMALPFVAWLVLRLVAGAASAWVLISISAWTLDWVVRHQRPFLGSMVFAGVGTGIAGAGLLCIVLVDVGASAGMAWRTLGVFALLVAALIWRAFGPAPARPDAGTAAAVAVSRLTWNAASLRLALCYGLFGFGYIIPATFLPVMAKQALGGSAVFAWSWPVFGLAAAVSVLAVAPLARRFGNRRVWLACHLIMMVGVLIPLASASMTAILVAALCVGGTFMVLTLAAMQEAKRVAGPQAPALIAAMTAAFATGQILGPLTIGVGGVEGFAGPLGLAALVLLAGAALLAWPERTAANINQRSDT